MTQTVVGVSTTPPLPGLSAVQQINNSLATIATDFAGAADPAALAGPYMTWADTGNSLLKRRNAAGNAWVTLGGLFTEKASTTQVMGPGQSLQNMLGSRAVNVDYTNSTGRPISVYVRATTTAAGGYIVLYLGVNAIQVVERSVSGAAAGVNVVVPPGWGYRITLANANLDYWSEYR